MSENDAKIELIHEHVAHAVRVVRKDKSLKTDEEKLAAVVKIVEAFFPDDPDLKWLEPIIVQITKFAFKVSTGKIALKNGCC